MAEVRCALRGRPRRTQHDPTAPQRLWRRASRVLAWVPGSDVHPSDPAADAPPPLAQHRDKRPKSSYVLNPMDEPLQNLQDTRSLNVRSAANRTVPLPLESEAAP